MHIKPAPAWMLARARRRVGSAALALVAVSLSPVLAGQASPASSTAPLAPTPPMGWSSWNKFGAAIDDPTIRAQADALVTTGMRDAGYIYVNIDDGWQGERNAAGALQPNAHFPDMKALAAYVHARGLKLGIYSTPNVKSCAKFNGSMGHEREDARQFADWGVDYLKYDLCGLNDYALRTTGSQDEADVLVRKAYSTMAEAIAAAGRPIIFSVSEYGLDRVWRWAPSIAASLWRTTGDITDTYQRMAEIGFGQAGLSAFATPGHWNDPDMLEVGNGGMTDVEYRTHLTLWAILAAPMIAGNDLTSMSPVTLSLLTQPELIAIDQDVAGKQGDRFSVEGYFEIWVRDLADGSKAVALFNRQETWMKGATMTLRPGDIGLDPAAGALKVRDIWNRIDLPLSGGELKRWVPAHGALLLRITRK